MKKILLFNRNFSLLWIGALISQLGDKFYFIAIAWWILMKTHSPLTMGFFLAASLLPGLVLGPFAGVLIDRWNRKYVLVLSDIIRGFLVCIIAYLSYIESLEVWHLFMSAIMVSITSAFFDPTTQAITPQIVPRKQLPRANASMQMIQGSSMILGPILGATFVNFFGFTLVFSLNGISYLLSSFFGSLMKMQPMNQEKKEFNFWCEIKEGWGFLIRNTRVILIILIIGIVHFFVGAFTVSAPFLANHLPGNHIQLLGYIEMMLGMGMFLASVFLQMRNKQRMKDSVLPLFTILFGLCFVAIGLFLRLDWQWISPYLILAFAVGAIIAYASVYWRSLLQIHVPTEMGGRIFSISSLVGNATLPLSYSFFGIVLKEFSISQALLASGLSLVILSMMLLLINKRI